MNYLSLPTRIFTSVPDFLAKQGLPLRGDYYDSKVVDWLTGKTKKYTYPEMQNEEISVMELII